MLYETWYDQVDALSAFLRSLSLDIPVMHCEKHIGEAVSEGEGERLKIGMRRFEINCQLASFLGAKRMVMHLWDGLTSDRQIENNLSAYPAFCSIAEKYGIGLMIENVVCAKANPLTHWRSLLRLDPAVRFTYDTKMAAFHGQTDQMYLPENRFLWEHIEHLHINDYAGGLRDFTQLKTLHVGKGRIDFERFFSFLREIGYQGDYTVEATSFLPDGVIRWDDLNDTFARIRALR